MTQQIVTANGIEIWTETFGDPAHPAVLLIMGSTAQAIWWEDAFCQQIADAGRFVIRFDHRDVGQSSTIDFQASPYGVNDLVHDCLGVLDAYGLRTAHLVGAAIGGQIAYLLALDHPDRVDSITLIWSSYAIHEVAQSFTGDKIEIDLPLPDPATISRVKNMLAPNTREEHIKHRAEIIMMGAGSKYPAEPDRVRDLMAREYDRARNWDAKDNHIYVSASSPPASVIRARLTTLTTPTLVIHGTEDRDLTIEHGEALADAIPNSTLLRIEGLGHQFHRRADPIMAQAIVEHTQAQTR